MQDSFSHLSEVQGYLVKTVERVLQLGRTVTFLKVNNLYSDHNLYHGSSQTSSKYVLLREDH